MSSNGYSTDVVARQVFRSLLSDFRACLGPQFALEAELAFEGGPNAFRSYQWPMIGYVDVFRFKAWMQLRNLCKRHIFSPDAFDQVTLEKRTVDSYFTAQLEFGQHRERSASTHEVLREARRIIRNILGEFDASEAASFVKVGKRATIGNPRAQASLEAKLCDPLAFTCPSALRKWFFNDYLPTDRLLKSIFKTTLKTGREKGLSLPFVVDSLKLVHVPKSWKTLRTITPLTNIGLFYTYAVGGLITERLKSCGLNICHLQKRHQALARKASIDRRLTTADMSRASDSILLWHLIRLLPRSWYKAIRPALTNKVIYGQGLEAETFSVLPMGNGFTFPLETLIFYALIRAIGSLLKKEGTYSVYGDDLIYPRSIHRYVERVFRDLGFTFNPDKTFSESYFRESCGGDYYRGCDVRPCLLPENPGGMLRRSQYVAYLYKVTNALRARWAPEEIPTTLNWLESEIKSFVGKPHQVPPSYPDTAGIKVDRPDRYSYRPVRYRLETWDPKLKCKVWCLTLEFDVWSQRPGKRQRVGDVRPYYWDTLRGSFFHRVANDSPFKWRTTVQEWAGFFSSLNIAASEPLLSYRREKRGGAEIAYSAACEPSSSFTDETRSVSSWT